MQSFNGQIKQLSLYSQVACCGSSRRAGGIATFLGGSAFFFDEAKCGLARHHLQFNHIFSSQHVNKVDALFHEAQSGPFFFTHWEYSLLHIVLELVSLISFICVGYQLYTIYRKRRSHNYRFLNICQGIFSPKERYHDKKTV